MRIMGIMSIILIMMTGLLLRGEDESGSQSLRGMFFQVQKRKLPNQNYLNDKDTHLKRNGTARE
jgi:hypothetical protein